MYETYQDHPKQAKGSIRVVLAVAFLACAIGAGIFLITRLASKPLAKEDARAQTGIVYDSSAVEGGWDNLSPEEIAEKLNEKVAEGMINISMNTAPYFENGKAEGNVMIVNESINNTPSRSSSSAMTRRRSFISPKQFRLARKLNEPNWTWSFRLAHTNAQRCSTILTPKLAMLLAQPGPSSQSPLKTNFSKRQRRFYHEEH